MSYIYTIKNKGEGKCGLSQHTVIAISSLLKGLIRRQSQQLQIPIEFIQIAAQMMNKRGVVVDEKYEVGPFGTVKVYDIYSQPRQSKK